MSRSWTPEGDDAGSAGGRAQTEPLAALLAITVLAGALALYGAYVTDVLPTTDDRDVSDRALEQAYHHVTEDGIYDSSTPIDAAIPTAAVPEGRYLYVEVSRIDVERGARRVVASATYAPDGSTPGGDPHPDASVAERPIPIREDPGNVTGGTLRVEVWQE